jgi:plastocyanin
MNVVRTYSVALVVGVLSLGVWGCGSASTTAPDSPSPAPGGAVTIDVVTVNGAQSFSPNPSAIPADQMVVWHNVDSITHRVVMDDGFIDTGNLAPGAFSFPMLLEATGGYHCTIHPEMVGTIKRP